MVSEGILGAMVGGTAAILASLVQAWFNRRNTEDRIEAENQRYYAESYVGEKVESLSKLHSKFIECRQVLSKQLGRKSDDMSEEDIQKEIIPLIDSLQAELDRASIFLDEEQIDELSDAYLKINIAGEFLEQEAKGGAQNITKVESGELINNTEVALEVIENEINEPIESFESN